MPEVTRLIETLKAGVEGLRESLRDPEAVAAVETAGSTIDRLVEIDRRAREYLKSGQLLMTADVVFAEGGEAAAAAQRHLRDAGLAERRAFEALEERTRRIQAASLIGAAVLAVLALTLLAWRRPASDDPGGASTLATRKAAGAPAQAPRDAADAKLLRDAAALCTDLARVSGPQELVALLGRMAATLKATGIIVWMGEAGGAELRPAAAYGYTEAEFARLPIIQQRADNATATAYRTATVQIVAPRDGDHPGAIIAPLLSQSGCLGVLTAEVPGDALAAENLRPLAVLFAAQLATVVAPAAPPAAARTATA
jgi:hypothetical protein